VAFFLKEGDVTAHLEHHSATFYNQKAPP